MKLASPENKGDIMAGNILSSFKSLIEEYDTRIPREFIEGTAGLREREKNNLLYTVPDAVLRQAKSFIDQLSQFDASYKENLNLILANRLKNRELSSLYEKLALYIKDHDNSKRE